MEGRKSPARTAVEAITDDTITINEVTYQLVGFTKFEDLDQVKVHVIFNSDRTFTILQIEISTDDNNGNNDNRGGSGSDDHGNKDNSNSSGGGD